MNAASTHTGPTAAAGRTMILSATTLAVSALGRDHLSARWAHLRVKFLISVAPHSTQIRVRTGCTNPGNQCRTPADACVCANGECEYDRAGVGHCICQAGFSGPRCDQKTTTPSLAPRAEPLDGLSISSDSSKGDQPTPSTGKLKDGICQQRLSSSQHRQIHMTGIDFELNLE